MNSNYPKNTINFQVKNLRNPLGTEKTIYIFEWLEEIRIKYEVLRRTVVCISMHLNDYT